ncbi:ABC transporter substrate-binding protein [Leptolyngbya sp. AN02str]|uniref:ABC transporter substrate-binding protein n=1 Tax=Leptolyngbya sp. AN02str TaxID=3423363 RepID=UPI003D310DAF
MNHFRLPSSRSRRRFLQWSGAALAGVALSSCRRTFTDVQSGSETGGDSNTLRIYTWAGYTDDELLENFREATGIQVVADVFDSNETMLARMQAGGGNTYSIIYPSDYMVQQMIELDMLMQLDPSQVTGLDTLLAKFQTLPGNEYSVPAVWGTTGLIYNAKTLQPNPTDWDDLWSNQSKLARKLTLSNDVREVLGASLRSLGYSYNSTNPQEIEEAYEKLLELRPAIVNFTTDGWQDLILSGDVLASMAYSSDAIQVMEENPDLAYIIPSSGSSLWVDTMAIPKTAPNPEAAYAWLNFVLEPSNLARIAERLKFATTSQAAIAQLPDELRQNKNLYPDEALLTKCEEIAPLDEETVELYDRYWTQLTSV